LFYHTGMLPGGDPIAKRFRTPVDEMCGDRAERVVLYGSRARGDAREDSDYDVPVFIRDPGTLADEQMNCIGSPPSAPIFCSTPAR
jgi:predicted nucleotidyltransferase